MKPALSIIIPMRNHARYLPRLFDSVLEQRFSPLEVVVVDDCSEDSCTEVVDAYRHKGLDIRVIRAVQRVYTLQARLMGVKEARADVITFVDADDVLWNRGSLEHHMAMMREQGPDILHFLAAVLDSEGVATEYENLEAALAPRLEGSEVFSRFTANRTYGVSVWAKLYARRLWLDVIAVAENSKIGPYFEDIYITSLLYFHARSYLHSGQAGYGYYRAGRPERDAGRAVGALVILEELSPYFRDKGCPEKDLERFILAMKERLCLAAGRFCRRLIYDADFAFSDQEIEEKLAGIDRNLFFKALLLGNGLNASKITQCVHAIYPQSVA